MAVPKIPNWDVQLAKMLGITPTPAVRQYFQAWARAEGGDAENNPFNTTQEGFGSIGSYNSVGVQRYGDPLQGLKATATTLQNGRYGNILQALKQGTDPMAMAQALAASPWGTGGLVEKILGGGGGGVSDQGSAPAPPPGLTMPPGAPNTGVPMLGPSKLSQLVNQAAPSPMAVNLLAPLGGIAAKVAQAGQAAIPFAPQPIQQMAATAPNDQAGGPNVPGAQVDPYQPTPVVPVQGATHGGTVPMVTGGDLSQRYPNLVAQSQVDWHHINPRLLMILQKEAEKRGVHVVVISGYRSRDYNAKIGGAQQSNHTKGLAVDAYINGHPIGDVIPPEEWARLGVRSGNTPGFFKGKPDPEHLDLAGIPVKGGKK
jgi:hypothetical protein